jgi:uncharacterized protein (DUF302 family)
MELTVEVPARFSVIIRLSEAINQDGLKVFLDHPRHHALK